MREQDTSDGMFAHFLLAQPARYFALRCCYPAEAPAFRHDPAAAQHLLCVCDETVLDPLFAAVSRPFRAVFRGLGAGFWNLGGQTEKMAKKREKTGKKWARNGLKKVGPMTE